MSPRSSAARVRRLVWSLGGLLVVILAVVLLPFLAVVGDARAAKGRLEASITALEGGDIAAARDHVVEARRRVNEARDGVDGVVDHLWGWWPGGETLVSDVGHLVTALSDVTSVAEVGVQALPAVTGDDATLFREDQVDAGTLRILIDDADSAQGHLRAASEELAEVEGTTPLLGGALARQRDRASARVASLAAALAEADPLLAKLPKMLGFEGRKLYLIALLNPAELRFSGGAGLSFVSMTWEDGTLSLDDPVTIAGDPRLLERLRWKHVAGNELLHPRLGRVPNATFAPSWSVSGEELLRAWRAAGRERHDGLIAVDVVALSTLLGAMGPLDVSGYGQLSEDNLVETLVGSYDDYYPNVTEQDALNAAVIPAFQRMLLESGDVLAKGSALRAAAAGRHLAFYFRDPSVQDAVASMGLANDLTEPQGDYLGVFTQNLNGSKIDIYQRRRLSLDVALNADGSAANRLTATVHNDTPPYALPGRDPRSGYYTRWAEQRFGVFLPEGVTVADAALGTSFEPAVKDFYQHDVVLHRGLLSPGEVASLVLGYTVPGAAEETDSGNLIYRLAVDPQATVIPGALDVTVQLPEGHQATGLPAGWTSSGDTLTYSTETLETTQVWEIPIVETP